MRPQPLIKAALVACLVGAVIVLTGSAGFAQQGGPPPDKGGGGGHTESAVNNLSYPALLIMGADASPAEPFAASVHVLGKTYSWGCNVVEGTYPNTSCWNYNPDGSVHYMTRAECMAYQACSGATTFDRIYWQKVATNLWAAETTASNTGVPANFLDWGDNLESRSWTTTSTIRVETTPFQDESSTLKVGYQMWHVFGQGPDEVWGLRATSDTDDAIPPTYAYYYESPFSIIHTTNARLNMAKLSKGTVTCPTIAPAASPYPLGLWSYDAANKGQWDGACTLRDEPYTAELNVGGKYVYGYNWAIRRDVLPATCEDFVRTNLAGWWRLTFYTPGDEVLFSDPGIPTAPPTLPLLVPLPALSVTPLSETGETVMLYNPVIDVTNNLTYLDICIKSSGGGKK